MIFPSDCFLFIFIIFSLFFIFSILKNMCPNVIVSDTLTWDLLSILDIWFALGVHQI